MHPDGKPSRVWINLSRQRKWDNLDYTIVMLAFSLPLSTSATGILAGLWFVGTALTFRPKEFGEAITNPAGGLPILLVLLAAVGMLWADATWSERAAGLRPFFKLLAIPLLLIQFQRSSRGWWPVYGLLAGCVVLMVASFAETLLARSMPGKLPGIVVKDYISQSGFFVICIFLLLEFAEQAWREQKLGLLFGQVALIVAFLIDISYVATSRTSLVVMPVLLLLFGLRRSWKVAIGASAVWAVLFVGTWASSPYLQHRLESAFSIRHDDTQLDAVSNRQRLAYWNASIELINQAPLIGHGTGSIPSLFRDYLAASPQSGLDGIANPHCSSSGNLRLIRHFEKRGSGSSGVRV